MGSAALVGALLVLNILLSLSVVSSRLFQHAADDTVSLAVIPLFVAIAVSSALLAVWHCASGDRTRLLRETPHHDEDRNDVHRMGTGPQYRSEQQAQRDRD